MKLRTKIRLFSSLFMLTLIILINTSIYILFNQVSKNSELERLSDQTNTIMTTLNTNPDIPKKELLSAFIPLNGMIRVYKENEDKPLLALTKKSEYIDLPGTFSTSESREVIKGVGEVDVAVIEKPVIWDDGEIVTLQISEHLFNLEQTMTTLFYVLLIASFLILIPTVLAGIILSRFLLRPIQALTATMKENTKQRKWKKIDVDNRSKDELYEMEKTFNSMIENLKENFEKQETFVSDASHELKTPISIVKSYAQLMKRRGMDHPEVLTESIQAIDTEADRMQKLVEQMLMLAKSEVKSVTEAVNLVHLCTETVSAFNGAYDREINFIKKNSKIQVMGNPDQLKQVIYILVDNGLKYSKSNIDLVINQTETEAVLTVQDYGEGIPQNELDHIFDRYYRIDKARSRETGGTGLGLAIAKAITEAHHGELSIKSVEGEGSIFTLKLPLDIHLT